MEERKISPRAVRSLLAASGLIFFFLWPAGFAFGWPWSTDMDRQPSIRSQESPLPPPDGTVPRQGKEPRIDRSKAARTLRNPVKPTRESIDNGKRLFQIYCALCHGADAKGDGTVTRKFSPPPDLTHEAYRQYSDGYFYATIRDGGSLMPRQGEALSPKERWDIVNYLRSVQGKKETNRGAAR